MVSAASMGLALAILLFIAAAAAQQHQQNSSFSCGKRCEISSDCSSGLSCNLDKLCDGDSCPIPGCNPKTNFVYSNASAHNPDYCTNNSSYRFFDCSPAIQARNLAALHLIHLEGTLLSHCNQSRVFEDSQLLVAMATGWLQNRSSCFRKIVITAENGRSVMATIIGECRSDDGCSAATGFRKPCSPRSLGATKAVWDALAGQTITGEIEVAWTWDKDSSSIERVVNIAVTGSGIIVILAILGFMWWTVLVRQTSTPDLDWPREFSYRALHRATNGFEIKVREGQFGAVFNGTLTAGDVVAVERMERPRQSCRGFQAEAILIGMIHHRNLVKITGFCYGSPDNLLVYEFVANGSLDAWIFDRNKCLTWATRISIATDVARGLSYLHGRMLHLDLKPQNILLDNEMSAKITGFGFPKLVGKEKSNIMAMKADAIGYLAPEWLNSGVTDKTDVYSFGILLLELMCCKRAVELSSDSVVFLGESAFDALESENVLELVDYRLIKAMGDGFTLSGFENVVRIALWCAQEDPSQRPTMTLVLKILEEIVDVDTIPSLERPTTSVLKASLGSLVNQLSRPLSSQSMGESTESRQVRMKYPVDVDWRAKGISCV